MSEKKDKNSKLNVIRFALLVSIICSSLITAAAVGLKGRQDANMALDKRINILKAANLLDEATPSKEEASRLYETRIKEVRVDSQGNIITEYAKDALHLYLYMQEDGETINGYIIPINTRGLWGKIHGYLAFENDGQTVSGFSVYSHSETPGLGGEIESAWFRKNFKGKKILNSQDKFVSVGIAKGKVENLPKEKQSHYVDGISGATLTGKYLTQGIKQTLLEYDAVSVTFRQKRLKTLKTDK